jgi:glycosyltransferase
MRKIQKSKITIITVVKNGMPYIEDSINSFNFQNYKNKELIVIYSESTNGTKQFLDKNKNKIDKLIIDNKSKNKYGSINLGIKKASGNIIGVLHADDFFASNNILTKIAYAHQNKKNIDITYGNVIFCKRNNINKISRYWKSEEYKKNLVNLGWMPPHTTLFIKKKIYKKLKYSNKYDISADYEFIIKLFSKKVNIKYIDLNVVVMRLGGISTSIKTLLEKTYEDIKVLKSFKKNYFKVIPYKILSKVNQLFVGKVKPFNLKIAKGDSLNIYSKVIERIKNKKSGYILSGLNLAFIGFIEKIEPDRSFRLWPDGVFSKFFTKKTKKFAGRNIINQIDTWGTKNIILVGNLNKHARIFLKEKKIRIKKYVQLPYGSIELIKKKVKKFSFQNINKKNFIIITLPTPKQEIIAKQIYYQNPNLKILCLGGALNIISGHEIPVPKFLEDLGLEFFWRLKTDPFRRSARLFTSFFRAILFMFFYRSEYEFKEK